MTTPARPAPGTEPRCPIHGLPLTPVECDRVAGGVILACSVPTCGECRLPERAEPTAGHSVGGTSAGRVEACTLALPYPPALNNLYATVRVGDKLRRVLSAKGREFKRTVGVRARAAGFALTTRPVRVTVDVYRPRRCGDLDGTLKAILDGLTGVIYADDEQVVEIVARRHEDKANPRAEVRIALLEAKQ